MPPGFLSSLAGKAQAKINSSGLAQHLPGAAHPSSTTEAQSGLDPAAPYKSHTLEALQNQIRVFGQQYTSTIPAQRIVTVSKSVAIDFDGVGRDAKAQSKEIYTWGQTEDADLKDVTDRLAYLNFVQGTLATTLAAKLDAARSPLKALRDAEKAIGPQRSLCSGLEDQLARLNNDAKVPMREKRVSELNEQIENAKRDKEPQERKIQLLKREGVRESEQRKWEALREYGEKLVILSKAVSPIVGALPTSPPTTESPYTGTQTTGAVRASLQRALDNYQTGYIDLPLQVTGSDLSQTDMRSFGETHASELSSINTDMSGTTHERLSFAPKSTAGHTPSKSPLPASVTPSAHIPPIDPSSLNQTPSPIPYATAQAPVVSSDPTALGMPPPPLPTVAETGVPLSGQGPSSGSLRNVNTASTISGSRAELSSERLAGESTQQPPATTRPQEASASNQYESAEQEKERLRLREGGQERHDEPPAYEN